MGRPFYSHYIIGAQWTEGVESGTPWSGPNLVPELGETKTLYAIWSEECTINFDANGNEDAQMPDPIKMCRELPVIIDDPGRSYDGFYPRYKYNGLYVDYWSLTPDCAEKVNLQVQTDEIDGDPWCDEDGEEHTSYRTRAITYEELFPEAGSSATLYAHWSRYSVNVHFDANGGEGEMEDWTIERETYDDPRYLPCDVTRQGYSFASWNTAPDGSGRSFGEYDDVWYSTFESLADEDGNVTLYAQWE